MSQVDLTALAPGANIWLCESQPGAFVMLVLELRADDPDAPIVYLTPDQARAVAEELIRVADEVDLSAGHDRAWW